MKEFLKISKHLGSSRTVLVLEDTSRTKFCGLGLSPESSWPWPLLRGGPALALYGMLSCFVWLAGYVCNYFRHRGTDFNFDLCVYIRP